MLFLCFSFLFFFSLNSFAQIIDYSTFMATCTYNNCNLQEENCTSISLTMPIVDENQACYDIVKTVIEEEIGIKKEGFRNLCKELFQNFSDYKEELSSLNLTDEPMPWYREIIITMSQYNTQFLSIIHQEYEFMGGAHGNGYRNYYNIDLTSNKILKSEDVFKNESISQVAGLIEFYMKKNYEIGENENLEDIGISFNKTNITSNFTFLENGIKFLYNPYEIASYVMGEIEVIIPYAALEDKIRPEILKKIKH